MTTRVGILGGTFDPIHLGHLDIAAESHRALDLDRVIVLPSRTPPHRSTEPGASSFHRFAMAAVAVVDLPVMSVSDLELRREGPSYTSTTLERFHAEGLQPSQLYFILGADAFSEIASWHDYPRLLDLSNFVVVSRQGFPMTKIAPAASKTGTGIFYVIAEPPDVSATEIRRRVSAGESIAGLVPRMVEDHIHRHRLYVPAAVAAAL